MSEIINLPVKTGWSELFSGSNKSKAILLAVGVLLNVCNIYITTTVLPSVIKEIGGLRFYSWNTSIFEIAAIIGAVYSARLFAAAGPGKAYQLALCLLIAGTTICAAASNMSVMLAGRLIQGFGGGLIFALSYAMIRIVFEERLWGRSMALISSMWGVGAFVGPFVGGIFAEQGHWRLAFVSIFVLSLGLLVLTRYTLPKENQDKKYLPVSKLKLVLLVLAVLSVSIGSIQEGLGASLIYIGMAILFLAALIISERRNGVRLLPSGAYNLAKRLGTIYMLMVLFSLIAAVEIFVPYFVQVIYGYSPLQSGYLAVLIALGWSFASMIFAGVNSRLLGQLTVIAALILAVSLYGLTLLIHENISDFELVALCISLFGTGIGLGVIWPHLAVKVLSLAPEGESELTSASITTIQLLTMTLGAAIGGLVANYGGMTYPGGVIGAKSSALMVYRFFMICPMIVIVLVALNRKFRNNLFGRIEEEQSPT